MHPSLDTKRKKFLRWLHNRSIEAELSLYPTDSLTDILDYVDERYPEGIDIISDCIQMGAIYHLLHLKKLEKQSENN